MATLKNKIDFAVILEVNNANPNGDPLNSNRPRVTYDGIGEISDVCIKRKLRNRFLDQGHAIFVQSDDYNVDNYPGLRQRAEGELKEAFANDKKTRSREVQKAACEKWLDVRSFGQVFAYGREKRGEGVSVGVRGPVSIHPAFSIAPVMTTSLQITKSVSDDGEAGKRGSDTMGMKHRVDHGVYVFYGSINTQLASLTGFSAQDAEVLKQSLITLFENDASSARPEGSMEVHKVIWWEHPNPTGKFSSAKVHRSLQVRVKEGVAEPKSITDYDIEIEELDGIKTEVYDGY